MRILVADNNRLFLQAVTEALTRDGGYEVLTALDGLGALDRLHSARPDCCVLDVLMPRLNGGRLCTYIKTDPEPKATPVILVTGMAGEIAGEAATRLADAVLAKGPLPALALITGSDVDGEDRTRQAVGLDLVLNKPFEMSEAVSQLEGLARRCPVPIARTAHPRAGDAEFTFPSRPVFLASGLTIARFSGTSWAGVVSSPKLHWPAAHTAPAGRRLPPGILPPAEPWEPQPKSASIITGTCAGGSRTARMARHIRPSSSTMAARDAWCVAAAPSGFWTSPCWPGNSST